jgi:hypothetical protein
MDKWNCQIQWNGNLIDTTKKDDKPSTVSTVKNQPFIVGRFDLSPLNSGLGTHFRPLVWIRIPN